MNDMMKRIFLFLVILWGGLVAAQAVPALHIFGGRNHDVYLGCLNASKYNSQSIWNRHGNYGNRFSATSIWNEYGTYGGTYSSYSPFNSYASYPPVIVDEEGNFYGYFTVNEYKRDRCTLKIVDLICASYGSIPDALDKWYELIFE